MRLLLIILCLFFVSYRVKVSAHYRDDLDDNEFAEFEDFEDEDDETVGSTTKDSASQQTSHSSNAGDQQGSKSQRSSGKDGVEDDDMDEDEEAVVEDDDIEFDEEEFEGFDSDRIGSKVDSKEAPKITITKVPLHLRTNWDSFYLEMLMVAGLVVYFLNFFAGKSRNHKLANAWFTTHRSLLEDNFSLVGDDGKVEADSSTSSSNSGNVGLVKESENIYTLWCSGRTCCEGMLVELKFLKRQDLVAVISQLLRPGGGGSSGADQVLVRVEMNKEDMDSFVLCVAARKTALRLSKDMSDLSLYCPERRPADKFGGPQGMLVLSEMGEVASSLLDSRLLTVLNRYTDMIDYIHFSDQFSGPKQPDDSTPTKLPDTKKVLLFGFNIPPTKSRPVGEVMEQMRPLMQLVFYCMEKVKRFRLSKEAKAKADKNRLRVEEAFLKTTHAARAEAAAARREERKRQEKERILQEEDPEKQRKWEEREARRQMKKRAPKMKQLKVKAL